MASGAQTGEPEPKRPEPQLKLVTAAYEHPWAVRFTHWLNPVAPAAYRSLTPKVLTRLENTPEPAKAPL